MTESQKGSKVAPALVEELETFGSYSSHSSILTSRNQLFPHKSFPQVSGDLIVRRLSFTKSRSPSLEIKREVAAAGDLQASTILNPLDFLVETSTPTKVEEETCSTLSLRLEAMTWAAIAKDATIVTLQQRLKAALLSVQAERDLNAHLQDELILSAKKYGLVQTEILETRKEKAVLEATTEKLRAQVKKLEAEALEQKRRIDSRLELLSERHPYSPRS